MTKNSWKHPEQPYSVVPVPLSLENRYDVHSANYVGRVVCFSLDLSTPVFQWKWTRYNCFWLLPYKICQPWVQSSDWIADTQLVCHLMICVMRDTSSSFVLRSYTRVPGYIFWNHDKIAIDHDQFLLPLQKYGNCYTRMHYAHPGARVLKYTHPQSTASPFGRINLAPSRHSIQAHR